MDWSNERYIRDTADWLLWPRQTRVLFILRNVDRAGQPLGKGGSAPWQ